MKTMMRTTTAAAALAILLSACGGSPTAGTEVAAGPSYDGGFTMGSGNQEVPADSVIPSGGSADSGTTEQSGYTIGSGN